jgi:hypothetical protein
LSAGSSKNREGKVLANKLAQEIEKILSDILGEFIAKATVKKNCELIGTTPDTLTADQLPELAEKIDKSVAFFSGEGEASGVGDKIKSIRV